MTIDKVVLVNTMGYSDSDIIKPGHNQLTLRFLEEGLLSAGFSNDDDDKIQMFPLRATEKEHYAEDLEIIKGWFKIDEVEKSNIIFAVTALTEHYHHFVDAVEHIRAAFPKSTIIAGGAHFNRENIYKDGKKCKDPVDIALEQNLADYVVVGNMEPFVKLVTKYGGVLPEDIQLQGLYYLKNGKVVGKGKGRMPELKTIPAITEDFDIEDKTVKYIHTNFDGRCRNACDFCIGSSNHNFDVELALSSIEKLLDGITTTIIHLTDPNPFDPRAIGFYLTLTEELDARGIDASFMTYMEPADLVEETYFNHLMTWFAEYNFMSFFVGRDAIDENTAKKIGRRHRGKLRKQEFLDTEKEALTRFINELNHEKFHLNKYEIVLSYTFSPFGNYDSTLALINEAEEYHNMSTDKVEVKSSIGILTPFPGTRIRAKYAQQIKDPEKFKDHSTARNAWDNSFGRQSKFLNYAGETIRLFDRISSTYFSSLRKDLSRAYKS
jgi:hypothetical protein